MWKNNNLLREQEEQSSQENFPSIPNIHCCVDIRGGLCYSNEEALQKSESFKSMISGFEALGLKEGRDYNYLYSDTSYLYFEVLNGNACSILSKGSSKAERYWSLWDKPKSAVVIALSRPDVNYLGQPYFVYHSYVLHLSFTKRQGQRRIGITHLIDLHSGRIESNENWRNHYIYWSFDNNKEELIKLLFDKNWNPYGLSDEEFYDEGFDE